MVTEDENQSVTVIVSQLVKPGYEEAYESWVKQIVSASASYGGHLGANVVRPKPGVHSEYVVIFKFDSYKNLKIWMESSDRASWIEQSKPFVVAEPKVQQITGLEAWFSLPGQPLKPPPRYKMALLTWGAVFVLINILTTFFIPLLGGLPAVLRTLILTGLMVTLLTYVVMPQITRLFKTWLYPKKQRKGNH